MRTADAVVVTRLSHDSTQIREAFARGLPDDRPVFGSRMQSEPLRSWPDDVPCKNGNPGESPDRRERILAVAGIARPERFMDRLAERFQVVRREAFADHKSFSAADFKRWSRIIEADRLHAVVTTEKDAMRLPKTGVDGVPIRYEPMKAEWSNSSHFQAWLAKQLQDDTEAPFKTDKNSRYLNHEGICEAYETRPLGFTDRCSGAMGITTGCGPQTNGPRNAVSGVLTGQGLAKSWNCGNGCLEKQGKAESSSQLERPPRTCKATLKSFPTGDGDGLLSTHGGQNVPNGHHHGQHHARAHSSRNSDGGFITNATISGSKATAEVHEYYAKAMPLQTNLSMLRGTMQRTKDRDKMQELSDQSAQKKNEADTWAKDFIENHRDPWLCLAHLNTWSHVPMLNYSRKY